MNNQIILNGIELSDLLSQFQDIVKNEVNQLANNPKPIDTQEPLLTRKETAKLLGGISLVTLNEWTKSGRIPSIKINTRVRYDRRAVLDAIKKG